MAEFDQHMPALLDMAVHPDLDSRLLARYEHGLGFAAARGLFWGLDALTERDDLVDLTRLGAAIELSPDLMASASGALLRHVRGRLADGGTADAAPVPDDDSNYLSTNGGWHH